MREPTERENVQKDTVLAKCFDCLVETGIEGASINNFSGSTGMTPSSLYYWFTDKDEIVLDDTEYGMKKVIGQLFDYAEKHINDIEQMRSGFPDVVKKHSASLRVVFQIAASPKYGEKTVEMSDELLDLYDDYARKFSKQMNLSYEKVRLIVDLVVSTVIDAVIWNGWEKLSREIDTILSCLSLEFENVLEKDR